MLAKNAWLSNDDKIYGKPGGMNPIIFAFSLCNQMQYATLEMLNDVTIKIKRTIKGSILNC